MAYGCVRPSLLHTGSLPPWHEYTVRALSQVQTVFHIRRMSFLNPGNATTEPAYYRVWLLSQLFYIVSPYRLSSWQQNYRLSHHSGKACEKKWASQQWHAMILYGHRWHLRIQQRYQSNMSLSLFFRVLDTLLLPHCQRQWRLLLSVFSSIQSDINYPEQNEISWIYLFSPGAGDMMMYRLRCGVNVKWYVNYSFLNANWMQTYSELNSPDTTW